MKCSRCGTENEGNICIKCGNHLYDNSNMQNSIFFGPIDNNYVDEKEPVKSIEKKSIQDEELKSIMNVTKQIIADNRSNDITHITNNNLEEKQKDMILEIPEQKELVLLEDNELEEVSNNVDQENKSYEIDNNKVQQNDIVLEDPKKEEFVPFENNKLELVDNNVDKENNFYPFSNNVEQQNILPQVPEQEELLFGKSELQEVDNSVYQENKSYEIDNNKVQQNDIALEVPKKEELALFENSKLEPVDNNVDKENNFYPFSNNVEQQNILPQVPEQEELVLFGKSELQEVDNSVYEENKSYQFENNEVQQNNTVLEVPEYKEITQFENNEIENKIEVENLNEIDSNKTGLVNIESEINNQELSKFQLDSNLNLDNSSKETELDIFINKNSNGIIHKKIGIIQGLLGNIWLLYRKCYVSGIILGIFDFLFMLYVIFLTETSLIVYLILRFIVYFIILKRIYINHAEKKVNKIKNKNPGLTEEQMNDKLKKSGGTTIVAPIIFIVVIITLLVIGTTYISKSATYKFYDLNVPANGWLLNDNASLVYIDDEKNCVVDISYGLKTDENITSKLYKAGLITEDQYVNKLDYNFNEMDKEIINEKEWFKVTILNENSTYEDVMVINNDNVIYFINFKGNDVDDYALCQPEFIDLKNGLKFD